MAATKLIDNWGRPVNYLRLAVTDRCNLRCFYCMPAEGIKYLPKQALLTYEEMERLVDLCCQLGINKVRITGGEPLVRRDILPFLGRLSTIQGLEAITMTTNGLLTLKYLDQLQKIGIRGINLSLDTLDSKRFESITRRDEFEKVYETLKVLINTDMEIKVNMVVMEGKNTEDIIPMADLTRDHDISVRYIEEMPFNGDKQFKHKLHWNYQAIKAELDKNFELQKMDDPANATAVHYKIAGAKGSLGIIAAHSRTFCGTCNRIRLTAQGELRTCLYAQKGLDLKTMLRSNASDQELKKAIVHAVNHRHKDGFAAENERIKASGWESMSTIGG
ncbi:MAG: GTP 3',8-cyclase MoaA [Fulvivirga sp.]|nr:GTP 3',8-cyclase MoaA [Fulvivirga sp.]